MLHDCNLKIYHPLNIQYEFNLGIIVLYIIEGKASISINHSKNEYKSGDVIIINDLELLVSSPIKIQSSPVLHSRG